MISLSGARLELGSRVIHVESGSTRRYRLLIDRVGKPGNQSVSHEDEFDIVIIAAPMMGGDAEFLKLRDVEWGVLKTARVQSHVTLFTTELPLSAHYFVSNTRSSVPYGPWILLTTSKSSVSPNIISITKESSPFIDRSACDPIVPASHGWDIGECDQVVYKYVYRIQSHTPLRDDEIAELVGRKLVDGSDLQSLGISWIHRKAWTSPSYDPSLPLPGRIELAHNLFYLGTAGLVLDTMETSCRMGQNVAYLVQTSA